MNPKKMLRKMLDCYILKALKKNPALQREADHALRWLNCFLKQEELAALENGRDHARLTGDRRPFNEVCQSVRKRLFTAEG